MNDLFWQSAQRPGLFSASLPPHYDPLGGGLMGDNPLMGLMATMGMQWAFGTQGYIPGQFLPSQNLADQIRAREYQNQYMQAMQQGARLDQPAMEQMFRGAANLFGVQYGPPQIAAGAAMARDMSAIMPYVAPFAPNTFDALYGSRGSQQIATHFMFQRGLHEVDPVTGLVGQTPDTISGRSGSLYRSIYETGTPGAGLLTMRGMGMGATAQMYTEMQRLGIGGGSVAGLSPGAQMEMFGVQRDPLNPDATRLRDVDTSSAKQAIQKMSGALSAIKDLFGEHGRPDAPMQELFQKLNDLTSGGLAMQDPSRLEGNIRQTQSLLRMGGISLDAYSSLLGRGGHIAATMGFDPAAAQSITMGAASMGMAYGAVPGASAPAWGRLGREQFTMADQQLRGAARVSPAVGQLAAMVRYQEEVGGLSGENLAIVEAAKRGDVDFFNQRPGLMLNNGLLSQFQEAAPGANEFVKHRAALEPYIEKYNLGRIGRNAMQPAEVRAGAANAFAYALGAHGIDGALNDEASGVLGNALFDMNLRDSADPATRSRILREKLSRVKGIGNRPDLAAIVAEGYGSFGEYSRTELNKDPQAVLQLNNAEVIASAGRMEAQAMEEGRIASVLSPLARSGPLARLADMVRGPGDNWKDRLARLMGVTGASVDDSVAAARRGPMRETLDRLKTADPSARLAMATAGSQASLAAYQAAVERGNPAEVEARRNEVNALVGGEGAQDAFNALRRQHGRALGSDEMLNQFLHMDPAGANRFLGKDGAGVHARLSGLAAVMGKSGGIVGLGESAGLNTKSQVDAGQLGDVMEQVNAVGQLQRNNRMEGGKWADGERTGKLAGRSLKDMLRMTTLALSDESTLKSMGHFKDVEGTRNKILELNALAAENNTTVEALMANNDTTNPLVAKARELYGTIGKEMHTYELQSGNRRGVHMTKADRGSLEKFKDAARDPLKAGRETVDYVLKKTGMDLSDDQKKELSDRLQHAADPEVAMLRLRHSADAQATLYGEGADKLDGAARDTLRRRAGHLRDFGDVGRGGMGRDRSTAMESLRGTIDEIDKKDKGEEEKKKEVKITFAPNQKITLEGNTLNFGGMTGTATGSVPV
jgi:hypothetical protein